jgi:hypothetical protein
MMSAIPSLIPFAGSTSAIPVALQQQNRWAPWVAVWNPKRGKYDKIPRRTGNHLVGLSTAEPERWSSFDAALKSFQAHAAELGGIGYCMTGPHGNVGIDLDDCVVDGKPAPWAAKVIEGLNSYTELSPSGNGYRVMGLGSTASDWTNHEVGIEVYGGHEPRFLTITGEHLAGTPTDLQPIDPFVLEDLLQQHGRVRKSAEVIDLVAPQLLDELLTPDLEALAMPDKIKRFMCDGDHSGQDRSGLLHACGVSLYTLGFSDQEVYSILVNNRHSMGVALDHRHQDVDRARLYLWREHCQKAKPKAASAVASPDEFDVVVGAASEPMALPPFKRDKNGSIYKTVENVTMAVRRADYCLMDIGFDEFRDEIMCTPVGQQQWRPFADDDYTRLRITLEKRGFKAVPRDLIRDVVLLVAKENRFDSAITWLSSLRWDGMQRIDNYLATYLGADDTPYSRAVSRYMWTALAGRVMQPGVKADMVPILVGEQGTRKSTSVAAMAPGVEFFVEVSLHEKDDNLSRLMRGRLVAEIGELRGLHTKELESIKAFITRTHENWVPKFFEFATQFPRRLLFVGTTNREEFLADETGNRRWLPVHIRMGDTQAIERDRDQLWAEAREMFNQGGVYYQAAQSMGVLVHEQHTIVDTWVDTISDWLDQADPLTGVVPRTRPHLRLAEVLASALGFEDKHMDQRATKRAASVLKTIGYRRQKVREGGKAIWAFVPCTAPDLSSP